MMARHYSHELLPPGAGDADLPPLRHAGLQQVVARVLQSRPSNAHAHPRPYTGAAGDAFGLWRVGRLTQQPDVAAEARQRAETALAAVQAARPGHVVLESLLDGTAGVVAICALMAAAAARDGDAAAATHAAQLQAAYASICQQAAAADTASTSDEWLYGRAGTLFGALLLRHQPGGAAALDIDSCVRPLAQRMLASGRALAARLQPAAGGSTGACPLLYLWPPGPRAEPYLGAAHGLMGILHVLLLAHRHAPGSLDASAGSRDLQDVAGVLRYVLSCELDAPGAPPGSGGHYPVLMQLQQQQQPGGHSTLVHWCHGAPGAVFLFCTAHEVLGGPDYLPAARRAGEVVWSLGLLRKGPGICHGVAGNAYALLRLYKATGERVWLQRAARFAAFITDAQQGQADWAAPDAPASLFEGLAGTACLLAELQAALAAGGSAQAVADSCAFPLYELAVYA